MGLFRRIKDPVEGHGTIVDRPPAPAVTAATCTMQIDLDDVPGVDRQVIRYREGSMMTVRWPEVGMRVAITVDRNHPDRAEVDWESVFGKVRGGLLGRAAELVADGAGVQLDLSKGPPPVEGELPADQLPARMMELSGRLQRGELTYEQYTAEVQRITGMG